MSDRKTMTITIERGGAEFHEIRAGLHERLKVLEADERTFANSFYQSTVGAAGRTSAERDEDAAAFAVLKGTIESERRTIGRLLTKLDAALYDVGSSKSGG